MKPEAKLSISILDLTAFVRKRLTREDRGIVPTPFPALNNFLGGGIQGLVCLAAGPGQGKSTLAGQIAIEAARRFIPVLYADIEHSLEFLLLRLYACATSRTIECVRDDLKRESLKLDATLKFLTVLPGGRFSPEDLQQNILNLGGEDSTTLVVVDSLQKLPYLHGANARETANIWVRELEYIKNNFPVVILMVSELSRGEGGRNYSNPALSSLKESGDLEYTAEQVLLLSSCAEGMSKINIAKNRYGKTGDVKDAVYSMENIRLWRMEEVQR